MNSTCPICGCDGPRKGCDCDPAAVEIIKDLDATIQNTLLAINNLAFRAESHPDPKFKDESLTKIRRICKGVMK